MSASGAAVSHPTSVAASPFRQPKAVWVVAFACVISFMGIGLVDPIQPDHRPAPRAPSVRNRRHGIGQALAPMFLFIRGQTEVGALAICREGGEDPAGAEGPSVEMRALGCACQ